MADSVCLVIGASGFLGYRFYGTLQDVGADVLFESLIEKFKEFKAAKAEAKSKTPA